MSEDFPQPHEIIHSLLLPSPTGNIYCHLSTHVDRGAEGLMTCPQSFHKGDSIKSPFFLILKLGSSPPHLLHYPDSKKAIFKDASLRPLAS